MNRLASLAVLALVPLVGCSNHVVSIGITVVTESCGGAAKPTEGVDTYRAVITGSQMEPITQTFAAGGQVQFEQIPPGEGRVLALTGYAGDPDNGGTPLAFGQTVPFTVPDNPDSPVTATVVLRKVNTFAGVPTVEDPSTCAKLTIPRAGHTATLMNDGRVLIAGGFSVKQGTDASIDAGGNPNNWVFHNEAEIFDPATNTSQSIATMTTHPPNQQNGHDNPGAFASASLLADGRVLISGGEVFGVGFSARNNALFYDPGENSWSEQPMSAPEIVAADGGPRLLERSHQAQITERNGGVIITGGVRYDLTSRQPVLVPEAIWFDPASNQFHAVEEGDATTPYSLGRAYPTATSVLDGSAIAVAGGELLDGGLASPPIVFFNYDSKVQTVDSPGYLGTFPSAEGDQNPLRSGGAIASLGADRRLLMFAGGMFPDGGLIDFSSLTDSTDVNFHNVIPLDRGRVDPCAVTLPDGRAVFIGGEVPGAPALTKPWADLYTSYSEDPIGVQAEPAADMLDSRKWQTCTVLQDGSVLVTGGVKEEAGKFEVLDTIELYTPVPL